MNEIEEVKSPEMLRDFLRAKGGNHKAYYQYTNCEALGKIVSGKTLLLTRADELNDLAECNGMSSAEKQKTYIASFTFGQMESVAMWIMYSKCYKKAVRVRFSLKQMNKLKKQLAKDSYAVSADKKDTGRYPVKDFYFSDIIYAHNKFFEHNAEKLLNSHDTPIECWKKSPVLHSLTKTAPWAYEKEVRLIVVLEKAEKDLKRILIELPKTADGISATLGPDTDDLCNIDIKFDKSILAGQISGEFLARFHSAGNENKNK